MFNCCSLTPIFVFSTKGSDPRVLEFVVLNVTDNYQWKNCIFLDICFRGLSGPHNQRKLEPHSRFWPCNFCQGTNKIPVNVTC
jgi:FixJ family two-component response regulator